MDTHHHTTSPDRARSRLKKTSPVKNRSRTSSVPSPLLQKYLRFSPLLLIAAVNGIVIWNVITRVDPQKLQHMIIPNSYAPMLLLLMSLSFFLGSYLFLNTGRGARIALITGLYFFLKFQHVFFSLSVYLFLLVLFFGLESSSFIKKWKFGSKNRPK